MPMYQQTLDNASGALVNCDLFPIRITQMPNGFDPQTLLEYFRFNIDYFAQPNNTFTPYNYCSPGFGQCFNDEDRFNAPYAQSMGAVVHIGIMGNNGSVVQSDYQMISGTSVHNYFTFSTLRSPLDGTHPVGDNRRFGIYNTIANPSEFTFYTLGVDRTWSFLDVFLNNATVPPAIFSGADALWTNMQNKMILFIQQHGGAAQLYN